MKADIVERKENKIFDRDEIKVSLKFPGSPTPNKASVQSFMAKILNTTPNHVEILSIKTLKGTEEAEVELLFWKNKEVKDLSKKEQEEKKEDNGDKNG